MLNISFYLSCVKYLWPWYPMLLCFRLLFIIFNIETEWRFFDKCVYYSVYFFIVFLFLQLLVPIHSRFRSTFANVSVCKFYFGSFSRLLLFAVDGSHFAFIVTRVVGVFCLYLRSVYVMIAFWNLILLVYVLNTAFQILCGDHRLKLCSFDRC